MQVTNVLFIIQFLGFMNPLKKKKKVGGKFLQNFVEVEMDLYIKSTEQGRDQKMQENYRTTEQWRKKEDKKNAVYLVFFAYNP